MKRYVIFAALGPLLGGFLLLLASTVTSGYWGHPPSLSEAGKLFAVFARTLQYSYLFGILPLLMLAAVDDIVSHIKRIGPWLRLLIVGAIGFATTELLYGLVGLVPAVVSSGVAHYLLDRPTEASIPPAAAG
jgi:hypothetical protein